MVLPSLTCLSFTTDDLATFVFETEDVVEFVDAEYLGIPSKILQGVRISVYLLPSRDLLTPGIPSGI